MNDVRPMEAPERLLRRDEVLGLCGIKKTLLYDLIHRGEFPAPIKVGSVPCWRPSDLARWQQGLSPERPPPGPPPGAPKRGRGRPRRT